MSTAKAIKITERLTAAALRATRTLGTTMLLREYATTYAPDTNAPTGAVTRSGSFNVAPIIDRSQSLQDDAPDYDAYTIAAAASAPFAPSTKCVLVDTASAKWQVVRVTAYNGPTNAAVAWRLELKRV